MRPDFRAGHVDEKGFSLVETLMAMGIFAFIVLGIVGMQVSSATSNSYSYGVDSAVYIAEEKLDQLRHLPITGISSGSDYCTGINRQNYSRTWTVTPDPPVLNTEATIVIEVSWDGGKHHVQISSSLFPL